MRRVVDKFIDELRSQLTPKKIRLAISGDARDWLATKGYDHHFGARALGRLIQTEIKDLLSEEILFGRLRNGGTVSIDLEEDRLTYAFARE